MRKTFLLLLIFTLAYLVGCNDKKLNRIDDFIVFVDQDYLIPTEHYEELKITDIFDCYWFFNKDNPYYMIVQNYEQFTTKVNSDNEFINRYDENFFAEKNLVIVQWETSNVGNIYDFEKVEVKGHQLILNRYVLIPTFTSPAFWNYCYFIEFEKTNINLNLFKLVSEVEYLKANTFYVETKPETFLELKETILFREDIFSITAIIEYVNLVDTSNMSSLEKSNFFASLNNSKVEEFGLGELKGTVFNPSSFNPYIGLSYKKTIDDEDLMKLFALYSNENIINIKFSIRYGVSYEEYIK